eukprot:UN28193
MMKTFIPSLHAGFGNRLFTLPLAKVRPKGRQGRSNFTLKFQLNMDSVSFLLLNNVIVKLTRNMIWIRNVLWRRKLRS